VWPAIIGGISGLVTGVLGALGAPWAKWRVDRAQATREWRRERLEEWRAGLAESERLDALSDRTFLLLPWYASLRRHLTESERNEVEFTSDNITYTVVAGTYHRHDLARMLADRIDALASGWELD
jgi:hypothetical protein